MDFRMRRIRLQFINCIDHLSGNNKKTFKLSAQVEMLTLIHGNPPANTSRKILCPSVLQDSVQGDLFCILQSCIRSDKWDLWSIKGYYSQKLPHLCWGKIHCCRFRRQSSPSVILITFLVHTIVHKVLITTPVCIFHCPEADNWESLKNYQSLKWTDIYWNSEMWGEERSIPVKDMARKNMNTNWLPVWNISVTFPQTFINIGPMWKPVRSQKFWWY